MVAQLASVAREKKLAAAWERELLAVRVLPWQAAVLQEQELVMQ